jgi:2-iminobutanoate/2-iminopropanoate deaminase
MNTVYSQVFTKPFPTRTTVGVDLRDVLVEISAVAFIKPGSR